MIVRSLSCESEDFLKLIDEPIAEISYLRKEIYEGNDKKLEKTVCIVYKPKIIDKK